MKLLIQLLSILRAMHWAHWGAHWKSKGDPFYADHLLFEKLYTGMVEEIDTLAEKIAGTYGAEALNDLAMIADAGRFLTGHELQDSNATMYQRALDMEDHLQKAIRTTYDALKADGDITLGMDDFLMALANDHETNQYLLGQKLRTASLRS